MKQRAAIDDMARIKALGNLTLSPSGKKIAFTVKDGGRGRQRAAVPG